MPAQPLAISISKLGIAAAAIALLISFLIAAFSSSRDEPASPLPELPVRIIDDITGAAFGRLLAYDGFESETLRETLAGSLPSFSRNPEAHWIRDATANTWIKEGDELRARESRSATFFSTAATGAVVSVSLPERGAGGLAVRAVGADAWLGFRHVAASGSVVATLVTPGGATIIAEAPIDARDDGALELTLAVFDGTARGYVAGVRVLEFGVRGAGLEGANLRFGLWAFGKDTVFDDFAMWELVTPPADG